MMEDKENPGGDDKKVEQLLRGAGRRPVLPDDLRDRMESTFRQALSKTQKRQRYRRAYALSAIAASLLVAVLLLVSFDDKSLRRDVAMATRQSGESSWRFAGDSGPLRVGNTISQGDVLSTGSGTVSLTPIGSRISIRIAKMSQVVFTAPDHLQVLAGQVYVDSDGDHSPLTLSTGDISVQHTGTQYIVARHNRTTEIAVREGEIRINQAGRVASARAEDGHAMLSVYSDDGSVETLVIEPYDRRFSWVTQLSPAIETNGMTIDEFYRWVARETGYNIIYMSAELAELTQHETLVGSIDTSDAFAALAAVEGTTPFVVTIDSSQGTITIGD